MTHSESEKLKEIQARLEAARKASPPSLCVEDVRQAVQSSVLINTPLEAELLRINRKNTVLFARLINLMYTPTEALKMLRHDALVQLVFGSEPGNAP